MSRPDAGDDPLSHEPETDLPHEPDEGWPDEPSEFDPESVGPAIPSPPEPGEADNPAAVRLFWKLVVVFNVALLAISVGAMLAVIRGRWDLGLQVLLFGVLAFAYGSFRYYRFRSDDERGVE